MKKLSSKNQFFIMYRTISNQGVGDTVIDAYGYSVRYLPSKKYQLVKESNRLLNFKNTSCPKEGCDPNYQCRQKNTEFKKVFIGYSHLGTFDNRDEELNFKPIYKLIPKHSIYSRDNYYPSDRSMKPLMRDNVMPGHISIPIQKYSVI